MTLNNDNTTWATGYDAASEVLKSRIGLELQPRAIANTSNYQQVVRMSAHTDTTTDIIKWWNGYRLRDIARSDILEPLDSVWDKAETENWISHTDPEPFSYEGTIYGIPLYKSYYVMYYSRAAMDKIGAKTPTTFEEFLDLCVELRDHDITPLGAGGATTWESLIWFQQLTGTIDPDFYEDLVENRAMFTDDVPREAMEIWRSMYQKELFSPPDFDFTDAPTRLRDGTLGMTLNATFQANTEGLDAEDIGVFLLPNVDGDIGPIAFIESGVFSVPRKAHKRDDALKLLGQWLATPVQEAWISFLKDTSANPAVIPKRSVVTDFAKDVTKDPPRELLRYWEASPPVLVEGNVQDLSSFMVDPTEHKARDVLHTMADRAEDEWRSWENS